MLKYSKICILLRSYFCKRNHEEWETLLRSRETTMSYNVIFLNDVAVSEPDDISRSERQLLLSVLINLNKFLRLRSTKVEDDTGEIIDGQIQETLPKSDLESKYCSRDFVGIIFPAVCMCHDMTGRRAIHPRTGVAHARDKMQAGNQTMDDGRIIESWVDSTIWLPNIVTVVT